MAWFKIDDGFQHSKKVLSIPRTQRMAAIGLWSLAGAWAAGEETDGFVPAYVLDEIGATPKLIEALIKARLWLDRGVTEARPSADRGSVGVEFMNWMEYQPSREQLEQKRAKSAERQANWRNRAAGVTSNKSVSNGVTDSVTHGVTNGTPDPTRPDPLTESNDSVTPLPPKGKPAKAASQGSRLTADFPVTSEMRAWASEKVPGLDIDSETPNFIDYWTSKPGTAGFKTDWVATWRMWMRRTFQDRGGSLPAAIPEIATERQHRKAARQAWLDAHGLSLAEFTELAEQLGSEAAAKASVEAKAGLVNA